MLSSWDEKYKVFQNTGILKPSSAWLLRQSLVRLFLSRNFFSQLSQSNKLFSYVSGEHGGLHPAQGQGCKRWTLSSGLHLSPAWACTMISLPADIRARATSEPALWEVERWSRRLCAERPLLHEGLQLWQCQHPRPCPQHCASHCQPTEQGLAQWVMEAHTQTEDLLTDRTSQTATEVSDSQC